MAMFAINDRLRVSIGVGLTWACAFFFSYGLSHATLDNEPFVFPVFQGVNLLIFLTAPIAQSTFYIIARKSAWLLNIYVAVSIVCFVVAWLNLLTDGGYRFTYWHQGDFECLHGCNDAWIFGHLVLMQGCILMFAPSALEGFSRSWRATLRFVLVAALLLVFATSCTLTISM
jgi:hypothetical protein